MSIPQNKEETIQQIEALVSAFQSQIDAFKNSEYSEAQLRIDFLNPLLKAFAWDVDNEQEKSQHLRDVIQEESIDVEDGSLTKTKKPDYTLRVGGYRKLFIEAKKPSINIETSKENAFQIRRYGWSANLGIAILNES